MSALSAASHPNCVQTRDSSPASAFYRGKRVLVTGAAGFLGRTLCSKLVSFEAAVIALDTEPTPESLCGSNLEWHRGDCRDVDLLARTLPGCEVVFSLSGRCGHWHSVLDPLGDLEANTLGPLALLIACRDWIPSAHVVYASTRQVYGRSSTLPVREDHPLAPLDPNGIHKMASELHHLLFYKQYGLRTTVLRLTNTYGPHMRLTPPGQSFVGEWLNRLLCGQDLIVFGDGSQLQDLNHSEDAVNALLLAAMHPAVSSGEVFNVGSGEARSLLEIATLLLETSQLPRKIRFEPFPSGHETIAIGNYLGDITKIRRLLRWAPCVPLREGLRSTWKALAKPSYEPPHSPKP